MQIKQSFITSNNRGNAGTCNPKYIVIHDTGNNRKGAGALNHYKWLNNNDDLGVSAHIFVDDKEALQVIPYDCMSFHTGVVYQKKIQVPDCKNYNSIGVEFCVNADANLEQTLKNLVDVVVQVQQLFNIPIERVITHYMSSGKQCPNTFMKNPALWETFKQNLATFQSNQNVFYQAVEELHQVGIINTPEYWQRQTNPNVQNLIMNMVNYLKKERGKNSCI